MVDTARQQAQDNFNKLHSKSLVTGLFDILGFSEHNKLLSLYDIRQLLGASAETYIGLREVPIDKIVGSESRYQDFTRSFLPKASHLKNRWVSIHTARSKDMILPPIQLFQIGDAYFVRDGNHRVSVAKNSGAEMIDADVTKIDTEIYLSPEMTQPEILQRVLEYERNRILKETRLANYIDIKQLNFTSLGAYTLVAQHILGHKHFMELKRKEQMASQDMPQDGPILIADNLVSFAEAAVSWYDTLFLPITKLIQENKLLSKFPKRTKADLYIWLVQHWQELKEQHGDELPLEEAVEEIVHDYSAPKRLTAYKKLLKGFDTSAIITKLSKLLYLLQRLAKK